MQFLYNCNAERGTLFSQLGCKAIWKEII